MTHDLDAANDVIMATKDSNYYGTAIEHTYDEGANTVKAAVLTRCGVDVPPFIVVPALAVNRDNLAQAWQEGVPPGPARGGHEGTRPVATCLTRTSVELHRRAERSRPRARSCSRMSGQP